MTATAVRSSELVVGPGDETGGTANITTAAHLRRSLPASRRSQPVVVRYPRMNEPRAACCEPRLATLCYDPPLVHDHDCQARGGLLRRRIDPPRGVLVRGGCGPSNT